LQTSRGFERGWMQYSRNAATLSTDNAMAPLWGSFRLVKITPKGGKARTVLLFKCNAHLAHPPWLSGLSAMLDQILSETRATCIYSIGTAGGTREDVRLGDVVVTNKAHLELKNPNNASP